MASDLKTDQVMAPSQRGPNLQLIGNPAVLLMFPSVAVAKFSITLMIKYPIDMEMHLTVYVEAYHIFSVHYFYQGSWQHYNVVFSTSTQI